MVRTAPELPYRAVCLFYIVMLSAFVCAVPTVAQQPTASRAPTASISGQVIDARTATPLAQASIVLEPMEIERGSSAGEGSLQPRAVQC
jgi:hypothetical protein